MPPLLQSIATQLENYGYDCEYLDKEGALTANHPTKIKFWVWPALEGARLLALFSFGIAAKNDRVALLEFVNKANRSCAVAKFAAGEIALEISAWYPPYYDKKSFANFFDAFLEEANSPPKIDAESVKKLFWDESPA